MIHIQRALISVSDKTGLEELARCLRESGTEILSTGGTANFLRERGIPVVDVSGYTGFPEIMDGRVKTLHPKVHGGLLALRGRESHLAQMKEQGIQPIDMVVVNLYPFRETAAREGVSFPEVVEQIDIGGPGMIRSAAKNHAFVAAVTDPADYPGVIEELKSNNGALGGATRFRLAQKAFASTASYDGAIAAWFAERAFAPDGVKVKKEEDRLPALEILALEKAADLRYGENPHQRGALYRRSGEEAHGVAGAEFLHGKELSYNNLLDSDAAWNLTLEFDRPAASVIKHTNPCGVAQADTIAEAYALARDCDPVSAFGSVVALNRPADGAAAEEISKTFVEVVLAPDFTGEALEILRQKKGIRLLRVRASVPRAPQHRQIGGGFLAQDKDEHILKPEDLKFVTKRRPTEEELQALLFGWRIVKHVKSNAIVFANAFRMLGIGAGQTSRVDAVKWGAMKAILPLEGCAVASDAFFPFADGLIAAAGYGARAAIQPGGSVRDEEVIAAADERGIAMVFTGIRHFKH
ncbi:MAG: bifunctional phosphoribosylaminoimidazolecarboxamide formyltransferase/IMP cyclohydrolase [Acidobacteriota bacterium]|jgi:phosphoribosylaminoimidazolecarboxamide formyltransferase/IMP cyclohydrolase|nr:bifunctional phosphoribosylaminoimidazolecarboxamide formyltransferase/IMP cyclohydrolase [Acidobacteriota bacterium]